MKKTIKIITVPAVIFLVIAFFSFVFSSGIKYEMVQHGQMESTNSFEAIVIRDETVMTVQKKGVLESMVNDGEMVRKNKHVASIYESEIDDEVKVSLENVNSRIEEIKKAKEQTGSAAAGGFRMESAMDAKVQEIMEATENGDMDSIAILGNELNLLNDKKNAIENGTDYIDEVLKRLENEKKEYEKKLGNAKEDIFAPIAGVYSTGTDGFEDIVTTDAIGEMTPYDFEAIKKIKKEGKSEKSDAAVCKIINGTRWSVAFVATHKEISKLKEGSGVYIRAKNHPEESEGRVSYISTPVNGNYLVIVTSDEGNSWALKERFVEIDLIRSKYEGLKVPVDALRVKDGTTGVFTVVDGIVHFKKVKVLYKDSVYAIVEENNAQKGGLLLYDEVITSSKKELKEGERIL